MESTLKRIENKPVVLTRKRNFLLISWRNVDFKRDNAKSDEFVYMLQVFNDEFRKWCTVYWGPRLEYKISHLTPMTCYKLRVLSQPRKDKAQVKESEHESLINFKVATDYFPYVTMHMTTAIRMGKSPQIRTIAHAAPHLLYTENRDHKTPLVQAIDKNDLHLLALLITLGAPVNSTYNPYHYKSDRKSPLMIAVYKGRLSIASYLIEKGAKSDAEDANGLNIVHYAVDSNNLENLKFAVELNPGGINCADRISGWTPLLRAVILKCDQEIVDYLIEMGARTDIRDKCGFDFKKHVELNAVKFLL